MAIYSGFFSILAHSGVSTSSVCTFTHFCFNQVPGGSRQESALVGDHVVVITIVIIIGKGDAHGDDDEDVHLLGWRE